MPPTIGIGVKHSSMCIAHHSRGGRGGKEVGAAHTQEAHLRQWPSATKYAKCQSQGVESPPTEFVLHRGHACSDSQVPSRRQCVKAKE